MLGVWRGGGGGLIGVAHKHNNKNKQINKQILAEMLRPMSPAFTELWLDGEKAATVEWRKEVDAMPGMDVDAKMVEDNGRGIVVDNPIEPLYGDIYLPREY